MDTPDVTKFQWTIIGLLLVLGLLEAVVHPTVLGYLKSIGAVVKKPIAPVASPSASPGGNNGGVK